MNAPGKLRWNPQSGHWSQDFAIKSSLEWREMGQAGFCIESIDQERGVSKSVSDRTMVRVLPYSCASSYGKFMP